MNQSPDMTTEQRLEAISESLNELIDTVDRIEVDLGHLIQAMRKLAEALSIKDSIDGLAQSVAQKHAARRKKRP